MFKQIVVNTILCVAYHTIKCSFIKCNPSFILVFDDLKNFDSTGRGLSPRCCSSPVIRQVNGNEPLLGIETRLHIVVSAGVQVSA